MAEVWLARSQGPGRFAKNVVLKTLGREIADNPDFVEMFLDEARLAALINHPCVVQIFDLGEEGGTLFIAMEYLEGRNLAHIGRAVADRGERFPPQIAARLIAEAAGGLDFAHELTDERGRSLNLVHRDVTAENIVVTYSGQVKLLDFGIAKAAESPHFTRPGTVKGKINYLAPEQVRGRDIDRRVDIWALGVNLYMLLCGRRPFSGRNEVELLKAIIDQPHVPAAVARPGIPEPLEGIIERALVKDPSARFPTAAEMRADLESYLATQSPTGSWALGEFMDRLFPPGRDKIRLTLEALVRAEAPAPPDRQDLPIMPMGEPSPVEPQPVAEAPAAGEARESPLKELGPAPGRHSLASDEYRVPDEVAEDRRLREPGTETEPAPPLPALSAEPDDSVATAPGPPVSGPLVRPPAVENTITHSHSDTRPLQRPRSRRALRTAGAGVLVVALGVAAGTGARLVHDRLSEGPIRPLSIAPVVDAGAVFAELAPADAGVEEKGTLGAPDAAAVAVVEVKKPEEPRKPDEPKKPEERKPSATLALTANARCEVYVDGKKSGPTPFSASLTPGEHTVKLVAASEGGAKKEFTVKLRDGETLERKVLFAKRGRPPGRGGR